MRRAVALTVCSASAVTTLPCRSSWPRTTAATGTSFVFAPTPACAATTEDAASGPTRAASSRTCVPSGFLAPLTALPSSLTCVNAGGQSSPPASGGPASPARSISQVPAAASSSSVPASVSTRQMVVFDGGGAGCGAAAQVQAGQGRRRHVRDPPGDRGIALHTGHDRRRGQRQHRRDRMVPALPRPPVRYLCQQFQQVTALIRYRK